MRPRLPAVFNILVKRVCLLILIMFLCAETFSEESVCYGTTASGRLENGVLLPSKGNNFESYSSVARALGRSYVHSDVLKIIVAAYAALESSQPEKVFKYAESGFKEGGKFKPHKTHQNGLSVDFMVPVVNKSGKSVHLPTNPLNKFGYKIEFDENSQYEDYSIDYEAMTAHIVELDKATKSAGFTLWRVIFDPNLQPNLYSTKYAEYLKANIQFSTKPFWVRHDEHYHIDFNIPCKK